MSAITNALVAAVQVGESVEYETDEGLQVSVVLSEDGGFRTITIREAGEVVRSFIAGEAGATRPDFYPDDLPFIPAASVAITEERTIWNLDEGDLAAKRKAFLREISDLARQGGAFVSSAESAIRDFASAETAAQKRDVMESFIAALEDGDRQRILATGGAFAATDSDTVIQEVVEFLGGRGWRGEEASGPPMVRWVFRKDGMQRDLFQTQLPGGLGVHLIAPYSIPEGAS